MSTTASSSSIVLLLLVAAVALLSTASAQNYAASFPGGSTGNVSNIGIPTFNLTSLPFTFEAWIYPLNTTNDYGSIFFSRGASPNISGLFIRTTYPVPNELHSVWNNADSTFSTNISVVWNQWHHVALVVNSSFQTVYYDQQSFTYPTLNETFDAFSVPGWLGWDPAGITRTFAGLMDEVRFWNVQKTLADFNAAQYTTLKGNEAGLIAYYNFDGQNAVDGTGHGYSGVANGVTYTPSTVFAQVISSSSSGAVAPAASSARQATSASPTSAASTGTTTSPIITASTASQPGGGNAAGVSAMVSPIVCAAVLAAAALLFA